MRPVNPQDSREISRVRSGGGSSRLFRDGDCSAYRRAASTHRRSSDAVERHRMGAALCALEESDGEPLNVTVWVAESRFVHVTVSPT